MTSPQRVEVKVRKVIPAVDRPLVELMTERLEVLDYRPAVTTDRRFAAEIVVQVWLSLMPVEWAAQRGEAIVEEALAWAAGDCRLRRSA